MTNQEALKNIEQIKMCAVGVCGEFCKYYDSSENRCKYDLETQHNSLDMAKKALERQIIKNNADRIRNMTDEELAEFLWGIMANSIDCANKWRFSDDCKEWLLKEAK